MKDKSSFWKKTREEYTVLDSKQMHDTIKDKFKGNVLNRTDIKSTNNNAAFGILGALAGGAGAS